MDNGMQHEMVVCETYSTGAQEWYCPVCGRRYILQWPPAYSKIVLEVGDEMAIHIGGSGGLQMGSAEVRSSQESSPSSQEQSFTHPENENISVEVDEDDPYLSPFSDWLNSKT